MATERARIQQRHGTYNDFNDNKATVITGELVIVDSGKPDSGEKTDAALYYKPQGKDPVRVANADEITSEIPDGAVTTDKIADKAITKAKLGDDVIAELDGKGVFAINEETVPESAQWDDEIPYTYVGEYGDVALWNGELWYLSAINEYGAKKTYAWERLLSLFDLEAVMDLAPLNPTAEQIAALPSGQLYSDVVNHKGIIKGGQEFYDTNYVDSKLSEKLPYPPTISLMSESDAFPKGQMFYYMGGTFIKTKPSGSSGYDSFVFSDSLNYSLSLKEDKFRYNQRPPYRAPVTEPNKSVWVWGGCVFILWDNGVSDVAYHPIWIRIGQRTVYKNSVPKTQETNCPYVPAYYAGDKWVRFANIDEGESESALEQKVYICTRVSCEKNDDGTWNYTYTWKPFPIGADSIASYGITDAYTKTEIDSMIGDIGTRLDQVRGVSNE